ncbi:glycosyltransferase family 2 protein [Beggiatoa leptomitoformis]|uniref:Glycosyltransferase n=1 Tax=Beggiatoa leptomitoformis TaxID=288004 RepID=A0A2N9YHI1_9GAMM|nr:glycosyltransferase family 2 protein [Beggiatoa leptomitoformis]ALG67822.1 glycosyltransferase [Beggiatoa leptomitoformis]AUI69923.1 glycosyltransferase [Beggiatoa leptomitoformis]
MHSLSLIIPVYNEAENIPLLQEKIAKTLAQLSYPYEIIYVDDGSQDQSFAVLTALAQNNAFIKVIQFTCNHGQTAAIAAGIDHATGDVIIFMDADLQNDPADIPMILNKLDEGYDLVSGWRANRQDAWLTRTLPSNMANWLISKVTGVRLHDYGCTLKAYRKEVLQGYRLYGEMHRFLPAYAAQVGARIAEIPVNHNPRRFGQSKYGLERIFKVILDLFTVKFLSKYGQKPIYLFGSIGAGFIVGSFLLLIYLLLDKFFYAQSLVTSPLLLMSAMFFIVGVQSIFFGLIGELLMRTYYESQDKPTYSIRTRFNITADKP